VTSSFRLYLIEFGLDLAPPTGDWPEMEQTAGYLADNWE
jgi:hypothetical protein